MKRHSDAIFIAAGACNPSGIAHSILDAIREMRAQPGHTGTAQECSDPALKLMVHQLAFICGVVSGAEEFARAPDYSAATSACKAESAS